MDRDQVLSSAKHDSGAVLDHALHPRLLGGPWSQPAAAADRLADGSGAGPVARSGDGPVPADPYCLPAADRGALSVAQDRDPAADPADLRVRRDVEIRDRGDWRVLPHDAQ